MQVTRYYKKTAVVAIILGIHLLDVLAEEVSIGEVSTGLLPLSTCLHGDNTVLTSNGGKAVKDLLIGDQVLTVDESGQLKYEVVVVDAHHDPNQRAVKFVRIETDTENVVTITDKHLIYAGEKLVTADAVRVGDEVIVYDADVPGKPSTTRVSNVSAVVDDGVYNPLVGGSGRILVGDVLVSTYPEIPAMPPRYMHWYPLLLKLMLNTLPTTDTMQRYCKHPHWNRYMMVVENTVLTYANAFTVK